MIRQQVFEHDGVDYMTTAVLYNEGAAPVVYELVGDEGVFYREVVRPGAQALVEHDPVLVGDFEWVSWCPVPPPRRRGGLCRFEMRREEPVPNWDALGWEA